MGFDSQAIGRRINELLVLGELDRTPQHGYGVAVAIEEGSGGFFTFSHGTLYPILHRLEHDGLAEGVWSDPEEGRPRKEYRLTDAGRRHLDELSREWIRLRDQLDGFLTAHGDGHGDVQTGAA
jgi:DNA-binding PadR family transcriptional regulator